MTRCNSHNRRTLRCATHAARNITGLACHSNRTRESIIIDAIAAYLDSLATPANLEIAMAHLDPDQAHTSLHLDLDRATTAAADLTQQRQRLALALAAGKLDPDLYRITDDKLLAILQAEQNRILDITSLIATLPDLDNRRQILAAIAATFRAWIQIAAPAAVSATLQAAGLRVEIESCRVLRVTLS